MVTLGIDAHKRTHTVVAVDVQGRQSAVKTIGANTKDHVGLLTWAEQSASAAACPTADPQSPARTVPASVGPTNRSSRLRYLHLAADMINPDPGVHTLPPSP
jgi:hypothetical protein